MGMDLRHGRGCWALTMSQQITLHLPDGRKVVAKKFKHPGFKELTQPLRRQTGSYRGVTTVTGKPTTLYRKARRASEVERLAAEAA